MGTTPPRRPPPGWREEQARLARRGARCAYCIVPLRLDSLGRCRNCGAPAEPEYETPEPPALERRAIEPAESPAGERAAPVPGGGASALGVSSPPAARGGLPTCRLCMDGGRLHLLPDQWETACPACGHGPLA